MPSTGTDAGLDAGGACAQCVAAAGGSDGECDTPMFECSQDPACVAIFSCAVSEGQGTPAGICNSGITQCMDAGGAGDAGAQAWNIFINMTWPCLCDTCGTQCPE